MDLNKLESFLTDLHVKSEKNPESAFTFFKEKWPLFVKDERKVLYGFIEGMCLRVTTDKNPLKKQLHWIAIALYCEKPILEGKILEESEDDIFPKLTLGEGIKVNQIVKIFQRLKRQGRLTGTYEQIAEAISIIFPIEYSTALTDLSDASRLKNVPDLFP